MVINSILWSINRYFMIADAALRWLLNRKVKIGIEREREIRIANYKMMPRRIRSRKRFNKRVRAYAKCTNERQFHIGIIAKKIRCPYLNHFHRITMTRDKEKYNFIHKFKCSLCKFLSAHIYVAVGNILK